MSTGDTRADDVLDGNAAAGLLAQLLGGDWTAASGCCDGCGLTGPLAETVAYLQAPGLVVRCRGCEAVLLRVVRAPDRAWLDLRGLRHVEIALGRRP
jgi:hypothetical protein